MIRRSRGPACGDATRHHAAGPPTQWLPLYGFIKEAAA